VQEAWATALLGGDASMVEIQKKVLGELWNWDRNVLGELEKRIRKAKNRARKM
jgi:hypothetical protein